MWPFFVAGVLRLNGAGYLQTLNVRTMNDNIHDAIANGPTLSKSLKEAIAKGFTANYKVISRGLCLEDEKIIYTPADIKISDFYRFEGYNDPDDSAILFLLETGTGNKGTLLDAYGVYANPVISDFIRRVKNIQKKTTL